jgi:hypothetical protein
MKVWNQPCHLFIAGQEGREVIHGRYQNKRVQRTAKGSM